MHSLRCQKTAKQFILKIRKILLVFPEVLLYKFTNSKALPFFEINFAAFND